MIIKGKKSEKHSLICDYESYYMHAISFYFTHLLNRTIVVYLSLLAYIAFNPMQSSVFDAVLG